MRLIINLCLLFTLSIIPDFRGGGGVQERGRGTPPSLPSTGSCGPPPPCTGGPPALLWGNRSCPWGSERLATWWSVLPQGVSPSPLCVLLFRPVSWGWSRGHREGLPSFTFPLRGSPLKRQPAPPLPTPGAPGSRVLVSWVCRHVHKHSSVPGPALLAQARGGCAAQTSVWKRPWRCREPFGR